MKGKLQALLVSLVRCALSVQSRLTAERGGGAGKRQAITLAWAVRVLCCLLGGLGALASRREFPRSITYATTAW